jgi:hypothetical protein
VNRMRNESNTTNPPSAPAAFAREPSRGGRWLRQVAASVACVALVASASEASAQEASPVVGTGKGIAGGALLGAELVMMPMGIAGVEPWWPYLFGALGAAGGGVGGWAVEQNVSAAEAPLYMLAGGLALVIPTVIVTLDATTRQTFDDDADPSTVTSTPAGEPGTAAPGSGTPLPGELPPDAPPPGAAPAPAAPAAPQPTSRRRVPRTAPPMAAVDWNAGQLRVGLPVPQVRNRYTIDEQQHFGVQQQTEVVVPVMRGSF